MDNKKILIIVITFISVLLSSCINENTKLEQLQDPTLGEEVIVMETNLGIIKIRLFPEIAPKAVENFKVLAKEGYFDGKTFFRVKKGEIIMAVDPKEKYSSGIWGEPFDDEFNKDYCHFNGAVSMANRGPNSNESSFFIVNGNHIDEDIINVMKELGEDEGFSDAVIDAYDNIGGLYELDYKHTVFGQVFEGMEVVEKISNVEVDYNYEPFEPVIIEKVEILPFEGK